MSGEVLVRALHARFERIRRAELTRLQKKIRGLSAADREVLELVTANVVRAIARTPASAIDPASDQDHPALVRTVADVFHISGEHQGSCAAPHTCRSQSS